MPRWIESARLRGLIFDMGDVLFDATLWRRWLLSELVLLGVSASYRPLFAVWDGDYLDAVHRGERDYSEALRSFLRAAGLEPETALALAERSALMQREIALRTRLFPHVAPTLDWLAEQGVRMAVLSDSECPAGQIEARLERMGVGGRLCAVISSRDLGVTKPHPQSYRAALFALGLDSRRTGFVGHDAQELAGAQSAGLAALAFNYEPAARADVYLSRFDELRHWVSSA